MGELIHTEEREGFTINLYFEEEMDSPRETFDYSEEEMAELLDKIDRGVYLWFCAKVTASKAGIELGTDYLGGCCYESAEAFMHPEGYYPSMVDQALTEARATLAKLCAPDSAAGEA